MAQQCLAVRIHQLSRTFSRKTVDFEEKPIRAWRNPKTEHAFGVAHFGSADSLWRK